MLVLGLGLGCKAKFCGLSLGTVALAVGLGLGLRGLALAKNSRPKSWRATMFTMTSIDSSELYFKIHAPYLLTVPTLAILLISTYHVSDE